MPTSITFTSNSKTTITKALLVPFCAAGMLVLGAASARAATFTPIVDPTNPTFTQALGINNAGTVVGYGNPIIYDGFQLTLPAIAANFTRQNVPGADGGTQVIGISGAGFTVGFSVASGVTSGFKDYGNGNSTTYYVDTFTQLLGINSNGFIAVGYSSTDSAGATSQIAFSVDDGGTNTNVNALLPYNYNSQATGVNDAGEVVGFYQSDDMGHFSAFTDIGGVITSFLAFGSQYTQALGVNNYGDIVGSYVDGDLITHGFLDRAGIFSVLDVPGSSSTVINGINDLGQVVGYYIDAGGATIGAIGEVPEPATLTLLGAALVALVGVARPRGFKA